MLGRLWRHMRQLWPTWTLLPAAPFVVWVLYCMARGERRWEHLGFLFGVPLLAYLGPRSKRAFRALLPMGLVGLLYDSMRFVKNIGVNEKTVHLCDLRNLELTLFGITVGGEKITLNDYFRVHHSTALDLFCAIPYGVFIFVPLGYAVWLYFKDFSAAQRFTWSFLALNVVAFCTYHLYPAAPPWYSTRARLRRRHERPRERGFAARPRGSKSSACTTSQGSMADRTTSSARCRRCTARIR